MTERSRNRSRVISASANPAPLSDADAQKLRDTVYRHYREHGRSLPWRETDDPYRIFVSEIMLQQTQVERVLKKYPGFIEALPDFQALASAPLGKVLALWEGLGYNRRALRLKRSAEDIVERRWGTLPDTVEALRELPGVGAATAGAIAAFAFGRPSVFVETNIRRVYLHFFFPGERDVPDRSLFPLVERSLDRSNPRVWYYALMDYGVMLKKLRRNPNVRSRHYRKQPPFEGSERQARGAILRLLVAEPGLSEGELAGRIGRDPAKTGAIVGKLVEEGFIERRGKGYRPVE